MGKAQRHTEERDAMDAQVLEFLEEDRHAILATKGRKGTPQLTPVWYVFEDGVLYVSAQTSTVKVRNLRRDATVSVCIDGGRKSVNFIRDDDMEGIPLKNFWQKVPD